MSATAALRMSAAEYLALAKGGARPRLAGAKRGVRVATRSMPRKTTGGRMTLEDVRAIVGEDPSQAETFSFELALRPTPKERPRHGGISKKTGKPITYTPKQTRAFERNVKSMVAHEMMLARRKIYRVPIDVSFEHVFKGEPDTFPTGKDDGDTSNLTKAVEDAVNKVLYLDDGLIMYNPRHGKRCGPKDKIIVTVIPVVGPGGSYPR